MKILCSLNKLVIFNISHLPVIDLSSPPKSGYISILPAIHLFAVLLKVSSKAENVIPHRKAQEDVLEYNTDETYFLF